MFEIMSENYLLNEKTYSFIASSSYMWGIAGVSQTMTQCNIGVGGVLEEAKIVPYT